MNEPRDSRLELWDRRELFRRWRDDYGLVHLTRVEEMFWFGRLGGHRRRTNCRPGTVVAEGANLAAVNIPDADEPINCFACLTDV